MIHGSLFSGIGGFDLAAKWAGIETIWQVENDSYCQKVLKKNFPKAKRYGDIKTIKIGDLEPVDIISGGFPCQPFSCAGKRRGAADDRFLWPEMLRIISEVRPTWVIAENVPGIVNMELDQVLADLESKGYETQMFIVPACALDAPHIRQRIWIIGYTKSPGTSKKCGICKRSKSNSIRTNKKNEYDFEDAKIIGCGSQRTESTGFIGVAGINDADCHAPDTSIKRLQGRDNGSEGINPKTMRLLSSRSDFNDASNSEGDSIRTGLCESEEERERWGRFDNQVWQEPWFEVATCLCGMDDGVPNRVDRLKSLGNAIVPQIAFQFFKMIKEIESNKDVLIDIQPN